MYMNLFWVVDCSSHEVMVMDIFGYCLTFLGPSPSSVGCVKIINSKTVKFTIVLGNMTVYRATVEMCPVVEIIRMTKKV